MQHPQNHFLVLSRKSVFPLEDKKRRKASNTEQVNVAETKRAAVDQSSNRNMESSRNPITMTSTTAAFKRER